MSLCHEVGAYFEAYKLNQDVTYLICVVCESDTEVFMVLSPCGICQERLVGVTNQRNSLEFLPLRELLQYHWSQVNGEML